MKLSITPAKGYAIIKEDQKDQIKEGSKLKDADFEIPEHVKKNVGVYGTILAVTNRPNISYEEFNTFWKSLKGQENPKLHALWQEFLADHETQFEVGQKVIFSRFISEYVYLEDEKGREIPRIVSVPTRSICAIIEDA